MPRFFRRLAEGVFDEEDVIRRAHQLADFVGEAARFYNFDPKRLIAVGYSNGANIAAAFLLVAARSVVVRNPAQGDGAACAQTVAGSN
jgi:phospholipase/carboxylesterase